MSKSLHPKYKEYLKKREGEVKERTLYLLKRVFQTFSNNGITPAKLNGEWFRSYRKENGEPLASSTLRHYITTARHFLKWSGLSKEQIDKQIDFKPRKADESITVEDLYTSEELKKIIDAAMNTRNRAMIECLYDLGARANELLSMTVEDIQHTQDGGAKITISGKTGKRSPLVFGCVPSLNAWLNVHPTGKGAVWVSTKEPFEPIKYAGLYRIVNLCIKRAGLTGKKRILHLLRHSRLSELYNSGLRGLALKVFAGWTKGSNMESVYVHLNTNDVDNEVRKASGRKVNETEIKTLLTTQKCSSCGTENPQSSYVCTVCNLPLSETLKRSQDNQELIDKVARLEKLVMLLYESVPEDMKD